MSSLYAYLAATNPPSAQGFGGLAAILIASIGIVKCIQIMRRPTTSALCVCGLMIWLLAWLCSTILGAGRGMQWHGPLYMAASILVLLLFVSAVIVAIVGLSLYDRDRFDQGRSQAAW